MPRFWDLFSVGLEARKGWIGAGFVRLAREFGVGKVRVGGLTSIFAGKFEFLQPQEQKEKQQQGQKQKKAWADCVLVIPPIAKVRDGWGTGRLWLGEEDRQQQRQKQKATAKARTNAGVLRLAQKDTRSGRISIC